jgi:Clp amino terminal domain, pathogenicity island component
VNDSGIDVEQERRYFRLVIAVEPPWRPVVSLVRGVLRFSGQARRALTLAAEEAARLRHNYIGTEHILLGIIREGENAALLESRGINLGMLRQQVEEIIGEGSHKPSGAIPYTPRAKKVLELSQREALRLGDRQAGSDHLLLGLIREREGVAAQVLIRLGADLGDLRQQLTLLPHCQHSGGGNRSSDPAPEQDDAGLHSVHYRLRWPSQAASTFNAAPVPDGEEPVLDEPVLGEPVLGEPVLGAILGRLDSIDSRLSVIEQHLGSTS